VAHRGLVRFGLVLLLVLLRWVALSLPLLPLPLRLLLLPLQQHAPPRVDERVDLLVALVPALLELVAVGRQLHLDLPPAVVLEDLGVGGALNGGGSGPVARAAAPAAAARRRRRPRVEAVRLDVAAGARAAHGRQADAVVGHGAVGGGGWWALGEGARWWRRRTVVSSLPLSVRCARA
jgi:hypothetical protein